jgi:hypothetical protein
LEKANLNKFDPFRSRLARDIRNSLSNSFLLALAEKAPELYRNKAGDYLAQNLEQPYQEYVRERLKKYDVVCDTIIHKSSNDKMQQAAVLWAYGLYFEMHELLEELWVKAEGTRRKALHGIIRAAGMKIHAESGNLKAAVSMGRKARADLELYGTSLTDFAALESLAAEVDRTLTEMAGI